MLPFVGTEHLLVGLAVVEGHAAVALTEAGVTVEQLRSVLERLAGELPAEPGDAQAHQASLPYPSPVVMALVQRARSLAGADQAPAAEIEHLVRALVEAGSDGARLLDSFRVALGELRHALEWAPEVQASAEAWSQMRIAKEEAIRVQDYAAAALHRNREKFLRDRYQLLRTAWLVGLGRPPT